jgi:hypothetical protein
MPLPPRNGVSGVTASSAQDHGAALYKLAYDSLNDIAPIGMISIVPFRIDRRGWHRTCTLSYLKR